MFLRFIKVIIIHCFLLSIIIISLNLFFINLNYFFFFLRFNYYLEKLIKSIVKNYLIL